MDRVKLLTEILLDVNARIDERDDAGIDLGEYNDDRALNALLTVVLNPSEEPTIMDVCGESVAQIWVKRNQFDAASYEKMHPMARAEAYDYIVGVKPEWITKFHLIR
ncbi:MAG: hypothetical protein WCF65_07095 [Parachlamydiaceae bacterium]